MRAVKKGTQIVIVSIFLFVIAAGRAEASEKTGSKRIEINTGIQRLYAFEGDKLIYDFIASTGLPIYPTPKGTFYPWIKLRYDRMSGGSVAQGNYYDLPNVPWVIYFYSDYVPQWRGYAIHGTYWHNNFGNPMSRGCINLRIEDAEKIYNWINLDTRIVIY